MAKGNYSPLKASHELYALKLALREWRSAKQQRHLSPPVRELVTNLETALDEAADAARNGENITFELNIWQQAAMTFPFELNDKNWEDMIE